MSEVDQLKLRINASKTVGVLTAHVREDYEPAGDTMMMFLLDSGDYVQRRTPLSSIKSAWRIFHKDYKPY